MTGFQILQHIDQNTVLEMGAQLVNILLILLATFIVLKLIRRGMKILDHKAILSPPLLITGHMILRWIVWVTTALLLFQQIGVSISNVWTMISAVLAMIAIGFVAVWSVLSNLLCTIMLILFQPFRVGDEIEIIDPAMTAGVSGKVRNINLLFTTLSLTTASPEEPVVYQVPNNILFQKIIRRKGGSRTFSLDQQLFEDRSLLANHHGKPAERSESAPAAAPHEPS